jgi:hypothetical protein
LHHSIQTQDSRYGQRPSQDSHDRDLKYPHASCKTRATIFILINIKIISIECSRKIS